MGRLLDPGQIEKEQELSVKQAQDELDLELAEVKETSVPDKYKGKTQEDIIKMHEEAEKKASRLANELHTLRTQTTTQVKKEPEKKDVTVDNLLENPEESVETIVTQSKTVRKLSEDLERLDREQGQRAFESRHPDYKNDLSNQDFIDWIAKSPLRSGLAQAADAYDFQAADALWGMWEERKQLVGEAEKKTKEAKETERKAKLKQGTLESGTGNTTESKKVWSRSQIRDLKTRALQGDREAMETVSNPQWQAQVLQAYIDKRTR
jgi:hypothetical protein